MRQEARDAWRRIRQERERMDALHWEALVMDAARVVPGARSAADQVTVLRGRGLRGLALVTALAALGPPVAGSASRVLELASRKRR